jgi:ABC-type lipoprotein export system ATPase subunit
VPLLLDGVTLQADSKRTITILDLLHELAQERHDDGLVVAHQELGQ